MVKTLLFREVDFKLNVTGDSDFKLNVTGDNDFKPKGNPIFTGPGYLHPSV